MIKRC